MRKRWLTMIGVLLAALVLAACSAEDEPATDTPEPAVPVAPTQELAETPRAATTATSPTTGEGVAPEESTQAPAPTAEPTEPPPPPVETEGPPAEPASALIGTTPGRPALIDFYADW